MSRQLGQRLRQVRAERGLLQAVVAQRAGVRQTAISQFEAGRRRPTTETLFKLAKALDVSLEYLLGNATEDPLSDPEIHVIARDLVRLRPESRRIIKDTIRRLLRQQGGRARRPG